MHEQRGGEALWRINVQTGEASAEMEKKEQQTYSFVGPARGGGIRRKLRAHQEEGYQMWSCERNKRRTSGHGVVWELIEGRQGQKRRKKVRRGEEDRESTNLLCQLQSKWGEKGDGKR